MNSSVIASVIVTCYNLEHYIGSAIDSVFAQQGNQGIEVVVVDDASTDGSLDVIRRYPGVKVVQISSNSGVLLATIAGIRSCSSDLLFFLDGDDIWMPNKLRSIIDVFAKDNDIGFVTHDLDFIGTYGTQLLRQSRPAQVLSASGNPDRLVKKGILNHSDYVWLGSAYAVRRSKVDLDSFCRWAESLPNARETYQDWPLAYWCASMDAVKCAYVDDKLMSYRIHASNYSGDAMTVDKAIRNLRKGYFTALAILWICRLRDLKGYPFWVSRRNELFYSYMISLYNGRRVSAGLKFIRLQAYLLISPNSFAKEWIRFLAILALGPQKFTSALKG